MSNNTVNTSNTSGCNAFNPEYCLYKLPCGTCMMLKSACPHILNKVQDSNYELPQTLLNDNKNVQLLDIPLSCQTCSNHPSNGGSGICNCTLGQRWNVTC